MFLLWLELLPWSLVSASVASKVLKYSMIKKKELRVGIVGAGPAGLMAAIAAASAGSRVVVYDQKPRPGLKLLSSGGGRCNFTNTLSAADFMADFGAHGRFMAPALKLFGSEKLQQYFVDAGLPVHSPDGFYVYPKSYSAKDVLAVLLEACRLQGVDLQLACQVKRLLFSEQGIMGIETPAGSVSFDRVIICTGGKGYPELGGSGGGYELARQAGHTITPLAPALVALKTVEKWPASLAGVSLKAVQVVLDLSGRGRKKITGDMLFTHLGVSGPAILDISGSVALALLNLKVVPLKINLRPEFSARDWMTMFGGWRTNSGKQELSTLLRGYFPASLVVALCEISGVKPSDNMARITRAQIESLATNFTALPLSVESTEGYAGAMATCGGVSLKEIDPTTLESRKIKGLYFAGEILDLVGPCGGYNLQWAFSSGRLAGSAAAGAL